MRTKAIALSKGAGISARAEIAALLVGLAISVAGAQLAHSATLPAQPGQTATAPQPQVHQQVAGAPTYTCPAKPGDWCDLRDWSGYGQPVTVQPGQ